MKEKSGSLGIAQSVLANKITVFFCWIGLLILFGGIALRRWDLQWWFWPLVAMLVISAFIFGLWFWLAQNKHRPFQSFVGWLIVVGILAIFFATPIWIELLIYSAQHLWVWISNSFSNLWSYNFEYAIYLFLQGCKFGPVIFILGIICAVMYLILNIRRRTV